MFWRISSRLSISGNVRLVFHWLGKIGFLQLTAAQAVTALLEPILLGAKNWGYVRFSLYWLSETKTL